MSYHYTDSVHTKSFTPKEAQVELCEVATRNNTIISFINQPGKKFICCQIIQHYINYGSGKKVFYVINNEQSKNNVRRHADAIKRLSCYSVLEYTEGAPQAVGAFQIIVCSIKNALFILENQRLTSSNIGLFVLHECHKIIQDESMQKLVSFIAINPFREQRILGIAGSLLQSIERPYNVKTEVGIVEKRLNCKLSTESDCVTILQQGASPAEILLEFTALGAVDAEAEILRSQITREISRAKEFLSEHHFEHMEYEGYEDDKDRVPDPAIEPLRLLDNFINVLDNFGLFPADVAAYCLLSQAENLKEQTPYERHFLLLAAVSSLFVKIRAMFDHFFESLPIKEKIYKYSSPKLLRLFEVISGFREKTEPFYPMQESQRRSDNDGDRTDLNCEDKLPKCDNVSLNVDNKPPLPVEPAVVTYPGKRTHWAKGTRRGLAQESKEPVRSHDLDPRTLCGLIFVDDDFIAKVVFYVLCELRKAAEFSFLRVHFTVAISSQLSDVALEKAYKQQELVLRHFRIRECNLLVSTSFLEFGIELPRCNLVVRFDPPRNYQSYAHGKARARGTDAVHIIMTPLVAVETNLMRLASCHAIEQILTKSRCLEESATENDEAERYNCLIQRFRPHPVADSAYVDLSTAITHINRYCAKLPSDTFTRLTPLWQLLTLPQDGNDLYVCSLRLPINCPIKKAIIGPVMPTKALARRFAALEACLNLHSGEELDDTLLPITKESFWSTEDGLPVVTEEDIVEDDAIIRPGTTKRRQYYNKKIAECLTDCRPVPGQSCYLYHISMTLTCPLPEEQNTRGRQIKAPEESPRGFGILTSRPIPAVGIFPIFTRAGEVAVELKLADKRAILTQKQIDKIVPFINFTFTSVLRLQKYLMMFDPDTSENSYFVVPTLTGIESDAARVDWEFLDKIYMAHNKPPETIPDQERVNYKFDVKRYEDAVVCPWYRNQDQPQYFYVAEICHYLTPRAAFPGSHYNTFETYYLHKYGIQIQNLSQSLLDVDHTSARLNFLTPRYVNRKGVALPTTSEAKKRAKRENLEQKQILVPELCDIHPFPASLWQKAVCLPCILHRLNALLLANEVRQLVARELGLGDPGDPDTVWTPLDFGWNLADVLKKTRGTEEPIVAADTGVEPIPSSDTSIVPFAESNDTRSESQDSMTYDTESGIEMEIGTWIPVPNGGSVMTSYDSNLRYGSPTAWLREQNSDMELDDSFSEGDSDCDADSDSDTSLDEDGEDCGLRIQFKTKDMAEAVDLHRRHPSLEDLEDECASTWDCQPDETDEAFRSNRLQHDAVLLTLKEKIRNGGILCTANEPFVLPWADDTKLTNDVPRSDEAEILGTTDNTKMNFTESFESHAKSLRHAEFIKQSILKHHLMNEIRELYSDEDDDSSLQSDSLQSGSLDEDFPSEHELHLDAQPELDFHPGPSPSLILQSLTMSNANDGINLERMETIGDSFLKYAITTYLYCSYPNVHEGKLSHLRSKQVSNLNLYRLGKVKVFAESMVATKFEPHDNWLPPCYFVPRELERALIEAGLPPSHWNQADLPALHSMTRQEIAELVKERSNSLEKNGTGPGTKLASQPEPQCFIPYNLITQHSIPDKSIADCVEALIGAYLVACGPRGALLFMSWLGIKVLPSVDVYCSAKEDIINLNDRLVGYTNPQPTGQPGNRAWKQTRFGCVEPPPSPLFRHISDPDGELSRLLTGFESFEAEIRYRFHEKSYLLQAVTHASYSANQLTDCYQRLEFLGDAVLDYLITRYLFEDPRHHSPGSLTDLRSALVNNTMFASLAVRHGFHKYFRHQCPALHQVLDRFVRIQQENNHAISDECYLVSENDSEEAEDVEVPKALGDVFESIAGAIYLDSGMSLDAVWRVYYRIMKPEIEMFSTHVPKSPIRELLELEPETAQFGKPEKLADGRRVRVSVEVFGKGIFKGIGRNYRIAKCTAAKCALKQLKRAVFLTRNK